MGKLLLTNNRLWFEELRSDFENLFFENFSYREDDVFLTVYNKMNIKSENFYKYNNDFSIGIGTLIYNEKMGAEALRLMIEDSKTKSIKELRLKMLGSYAVLIKNDHGIDVFLDETHTYYLYYYTDGKSYILTNTYWHIGKVVKAEINEVQMLEQGVRRCIMSNSTPFKGVFKLSAREAIHIDLMNNSFKIITIELNDYHKSFQSGSEAVDAILREIKEISSIRSKYIDKCLHFLTGGIDSRLEAAVNIYNDDSLIFGYWMGKDLLTNGTSNDVKIVKDISQYYGIEYKLYDVCEDFKVSLASITKSKCKTFGEFAGNYVGNTKLFNIFENISDCNWCGFGYLGETMRPLSELDRSCTSDYSIKKFIQDVYCRTGLENIFYLEGFYEHIEDEFVNILNLKNNTKIDIDSAFKLFSYSRYDADSYMNNFVNMFMYSFPIFGQKRIADLIDSLQYSWLEGDFISISLMKQLNEELLLFPIYSHHREYAYDKNTSTMQKNYKYEILDRLKQLFKDTPIYKLLYLKWLHKYIRPQSATNNDICLECASQIDNISILKDVSYKIKFNGEWNGIDIGTLARFVADLKVLDKIRS